MRCFLILRTIHYTVFMLLFVFFFQAEDGIRDLVRSRGLGDVYKRQAEFCSRNRSLQPSSPFNNCAISALKPDRARVA